MTDSSGNLLPISRLQTSPHIGVNSLGICSDGRLVLWEQNSRAQHSVGLLAPTGSGSLDWTDLKSDLLSTVVAGAERELGEESHRAKAHILDRVLKTQVLGYFRWVNRSCLPGFLLVMKLRVPSAELVPNVTEVIRGQMKTEFPAANLDELRSTVAELLSGGSGLPLSTPLFALVRALDRWIEDPAETESVRQFLDS